jgi:hypothetical protein
MDKPYSRPWYRLHWLTWLATAVVIGALAIRQCDEVAVFGFSNLGMYFGWSYFGWPFANVDQSVTIVMGFTPPEFEFNWHPWRIAGNIACGVLLVGSTAFVCESWLRRPRRLQFRLRHLFVLPVLVGAMILLGHEWELPYRDYDPENLQITWSLVSLSDAVQPLRWPVLLSLVGTVYSLCWLAYSVCLRAYRLIFPFRG